LLLWTSLRRFLLVFTQREIVLIHARSANAVRVIPLSMVRAVRAVDGMLEINYGPPDAGLFLHVPCDEREVLLVFRLLCWWEAHTG
jgi:hypothetical protein